jgi:hypothetical protein
MNEILSGFLAGLTMEQVQPYADASMSLYEMNSYRTYIEKNGENEYIQFLKRYRALDLPMKYANILAQAAESGISLNKLDYIAEKNFSIEQTKFLLDHLQKDIATKTNEETHKYAGKNKGDMKDR